VKLVYTILQLQSNVRIKNQLCVVDIVVMCSYSEVSTRGRPRPRRLGHGLVILASNSEFWLRSLPCPFVLV